MAAETEIASRDPRHALGRRGEDLAAAFFARKGYEICARNWRCRGGELDLVVRKGDELRLIEVKTRARLARGASAIAPHDAVDGRKLARMGIAAALFLARHPELPQDTHFDVLSVAFTDADVPVYRWLRDVE